MGKSTRLSGYIYALHLKGDPQVRYIGLTTGTVEKRFIQHSSDARIGRYDWPLYRWMRKHGVENVTFSIIEHVSDNSAADLEAREVFYIAEARAKYGALILNLRDGGNVSKHSEESKRRMSEAQRGNKNALGYRHSPESIQRMSSAQRGKKRSPETIAKLRAREYSPETRLKMSESARGNSSHLGHVHTDETKSLISKILTGREISESHKQKMSQRMKGNTIMLGRTHSEETKRKMSISRTGLRHSDESKAKMSASNKGRLVSDQARANISAATGLGQHTRWHSNRGIIKDSCAFCMKP